MEKILLSAVLTLCYWSVFSQGSISGTITDAKTKEAIIGANVVIQGTTTGVQTDVEGKFLIPNLKAGSYNLQISFITYKTHVVPDVLVEDGKRISIDVPMSEEVSELKEVVVSGTRQTNTDYELVRSMKEAKVIVVGVTSEQIAKTLDRDASQVLRRVPGVTIRNDQFVQIRGLSERYNAVLLHNAYAPSVETDIRSFSFATLPSNQIDRILIFKSPAADLPGDFAGGVVKVFTKSVPDENNLTLDYSTQVRLGTTFQNYQYQKKDPNHYNGLNNGYYDLPASFPADLAASNINDAQRTHAANSLKNLWTAQSGTAIPDQRLNLTFTKKFNLGKVQIGNISALTYSNAYGIYNIKRGDFTTTGGVAQSVNNFYDEQYNQQIRTGLLFNWAFKFSPSHLIELKNLLNQSSNDQFVYRQGQEGSSIKGGSFDKIYRSIYSGQLMGTHKLFDNKTQIEWVAGYNSSKRDQPDFKKYRYAVSEGNPDQLIISNVANPNYLGRFFAKLNETSTTGGISLKQQLGFAKDPSLNPEIKVGGFYENKSRDFGARNIGYINGTDPSTTATVQNLPIGQVFDPQYTTTGIRISEDTKKKDSYTASNQLMASYIMASIPFTTKWKLDAGVRVEDNRQVLDSYDDLHSMPANVNNSVTRWLPSANLSYNFTQKMLVRGAYGKTLNRPEFRELAPFSFYDYNLNFVFTGNQFLKTAQIQNIDVRWEYYPNKGELITAGAFYKSFTNPIEVIADPNNGGVRQATYDNPSSAMAYGIEVEVKKSLANVSGSRLLNKLSFMFNASFIRSGISLRADQAAGQRTDRPLQGQAPYVFNTGIFYNNENNGWQMNLLHNVVGKSIFIVGNNYYADVYLMPRNVIDLTFSKKIGDRFQIRGGVSDILNQPMLLLQDGNNGHVKYNAQNDGHVQDYRPGQVFSIGFSAKLNK